MRIRLAVTAAFVVLAADTVTKLVAPRDGWTWHDVTAPDGKPPTWNAAAVIGAGLLLVWLFRSIGMAVAIAGVIGNVAWAALAGGNPNPMTDETLSRPGDMVAFNVADVALQGGALFATVEIAVAVAVLLDPLVRRAILRIPIPR